MIFDSLGSSLIIIFGLAQIVYAIWGVVTKEANNKHLTWILVLKNILVFMLIVASLYFVTVAIFDAVIDTVTDESFSILLTSYVIIISTTFVLVIDFIFDPFDLKKSLLSKENTIYPPKSTKTPEFLHPPKSISKAAEQ